MKEMSVIIKVYRSAENNNVESDSSIVFDIAINF